MDSDVKMMLIQTQAHVTAQVLRSIGGAASAVGKAAETFIDGLAEGIESGMRMWAEQCWRQKERALYEEQAKRQAAIGEGAGILRALFVELLGQDAWKAFEKMRAEKGRRTFNPLEWTEFFESVFAKAKTEAEAKAAAPEKPTETSSS